MARNQGGQPGQQTKKVTCKGCGRLNEDGNKYCPSCGCDPKSGKKAGPTKIEFEIEVTYSGDFGRYNIRVQVTKNGQGEDDGKVWVSGFKPTDKVVVGSNTNTSGGCPTHLELDLVKGFTTFDYEFQGGKRLLEFAACGNQANTYLKLRGPKYTSQPNQRFWQRLRESIRHKQGRD